MPSKPLLFSPSPTSPDDVAKRTAEDGVWEDTDPNYIPGYSDIVKANEISTINAQVIDGAGNTKADYYQRFGASPRDLPVEFAWLPISDGVGKSSRIADKDRGVWLRRGYRACTLDEFNTLKAEIPGLDLPYDAHVEADGTIRKGIDSALHVVRRDAAPYVAHKRQQESLRRRRLSSRHVQGAETRQEFDVVENESGKIAVGERD